MLLLNNVLCMHMRPITQQLQLFLYQAKQVLASCPYIYSKASLTTTGTCLGWQSGNTCILGNAAMHSDWICSDAVDKVKYWKLHL